MKVSINELEDRITPRICIMKEYENRIDVEDESIGKNVVYVGNVYGLVYYDNQLCGNASISRNDIGDDGTEKVVWAVKTNEKSLFSPYTMIFHYREENVNTNLHLDSLRSCAKDKCLVLKDKLINMFSAP